jgi:hypothetical protein
LVVVFICARHNPSLHIRTSHDGHFLGTLADIGRPIARIQSR